MLRWIDNNTAKQNAWIYHKFDNTRGSVYARARSVEFGAIEIMEQEMVSIAGGVR